MFAEQACLSCGCIECVDFRFLTSFGMTIWGVWNNGGYGAELRRDLNNGGGYFGMWNDGGRVFRMTASFASVIVVSGYAGCGICDCDDGEFMFRLSGVCN